MKESCLLAGFRAADEALKSCEFYGRNVGNLTEQEIEEINLALEPHQLTDEDVDLLYLEVSGQEHEQNL